MFESVVSSNFDAVALLRYGRFDESAFILRLALTSIQEASHEHSIREPSSSAEGETMVGQVVSVPIQDNDKAITFSYSSCFELFDRAFILEGVDSPSLSDEAASLCASVCLYNMALALHLKGLIQGGMDCLRKASGLYQKVFTILSSLSTKPTHSTSSLLLATVMNIIACEGEFGGPTADAVIHWKSVFGEYYSWLTSDDEEHPVIYSNPEETDLFTTCAVMFYNQTFAVAAAA